MKKLIILIFIFIGFSISINAQRSYDLGLWGGGSYYLGDINTSSHFKKIHPSVGVFLRYNYNTRTAIRGSLFYGTLSGVDQSSRYLYQKIRSYSFSTPILDLTGQFEFNFLPYAIGSDTKNFSPYVSAGLSFLLAANSGNPYQIVVPMGIGLKFNISEKIGAGIEYSFRKTFSDQIDNLGGIENSVTNHQSHFKQLAYSHDNDWYAFIGFFISYNIKIDNFVCRAYDY